MCLLKDSTKFCRYCGAKIPVDSKFCEECGKTLVLPEKPVKDSTTEDIHKTHESRRPIAISLIALILVSLFVLSVAPNPIIKNRPWLSVEDVSIDLLDWGTGTVSAEPLLVITIHNPTHRTSTIQFNNADLGVTISGYTWHFSTYTPSIFQSDNWTDLAGSVELPACSSILVGLDFQQYQPSFPAYFAQVTFRLNLLVEINGMPVTLTENWTTSFVSTPAQTTTTTATTTTSAPYTPPNECLLPWV
jgi:ribosomal protein L40E